METFALFSVGLLCFSYSFLMSVLSYKLLKEVDK